MFYTYRQDLIQIQSSREEIFRLMIITLILVTRFDWIDQGCHWKPISTVTAAPPSLPPVLLPFPFILLI